MAQMLSYDDLAQRWGLSPKTVQRLARESKLPRPVRIGGSVRFRAAAIDAFERAGSLHEVGRAELRRLTQQFGLAIAGEAIMDGLTDGEARRRFDRRYADRLNHLTMVLANRRVARGVLVRELNAESGMDKLIAKSKLPTLAGVAAAAEANRTGHFPTRA